MKAPRRYENTLNDPRRRNPRSWPTPPMDDYKAIAALRLARAQSLLTHAVVLIRSGQAGAASPLIDAALETVARPFGPFEHEAAQYMEAPR